MVTAATRLKHTALVAITVILSGCTVATPSGVPTHSSATTGVDHEPVVRISGLEADDVFSTTTVEQWVKQADYVAVVRITAENELPASESAKQRGEGLVGRKVTAEIAQIVWAHPKTQRSIPQAVEFNAAGWAFKDGIESKYRIGFPGRPYLLPGHSYLMALRFTEWGCPGRMDPEDGESVSYWGPFGALGVVPFDGVLGTGEFEGRVTEVAGGSDPENSFRKAMREQTTDWVAQRLTAAHQKDQSLTHKPGPVDCGGD